jgi:hypothetical protein
VTWGLTEHFSCVVALDLTFVQEVSASTDADAMLISSFV